MMIIAGSSGIVTFISQFFSFEFFFLIFFSEPWLTKELEVNLETLTSPL
jgi:hypothetical protein